MKTAPLLSIGMIFKNEERCLERCLKSLEPLRKAIPCELIMADTGAEDGSREIAGRYADEVFDFAWCDDFSAARNAVMDRCSGKWYMSIDCDEWLDTDVTELIRFLKSRKKPDFAFVVVRNYYSVELEQGEIFNEFHALRLIRMSTGQRYHGMIHESWLYQEPGEWLTHTVLHHDGYVLADPEARKNKARRNMALLRQQLKETPDDLRTLKQCIESGRGDAGLVQYVRTAVELVQKKSGQWAHYGPILLSHAAEAARVHEMPEREEWIAYAEKTFPDSIFTLVDVSYQAFLAAHKEKKWEKAIHYGEMYQKGIRLLRAARQSDPLKEELGRNPVSYGSPASERTVMIGLADAYCKNKQDEKAVEILTGTDGAKLSPGLVRNATAILVQLHAQSMQNIAPVLTAFYDQISQENRDKQKQKARLDAFGSIAAAVFTKKHRNEEKGYDGYCRPAYTAFRCLAGKCEAGRAAELMSAIDPAQIRGWLARVENWQALPIEALEYALQEEVAFPLAEKPLPVEVLDGLAARLTHGGNMARQLVLAVDGHQEYPTLQSLFWAQSLALAALRSFDWSLGKSNAPASGFACPEKKNKPDERPEDTPETGLALIRRFAQIESAVLPLLYTPQALAGENAALLPPMHRWGLYCSLAFGALDAGKPQNYLALLRKGLKDCPGEKDMVQFLLDRFREDARPKASAELLALAEKIKSILAAYDPADPAVAAIRKSPAYKQVAWIIEGEPGRPAQPARRAYRPARKPVRAVFFAELGEKWDAMQSVYAFMQNDPRFDPVVVRTPVFRIAQQNGEQKKETLYKDFLSPLGIPALGYDEYDLAADCPDLAFISQPYESCTLPQFWPENIAKHTRLVYLPYYLPDKVEGTAQTTLAQMPVYYHAWKVVCSGKKHLAFYRRYAANQGANALVTGLPKTDALTALRGSPAPLPAGWGKLQDKTVFLWNSWYDLSVSSLRYFDALMDWFAAHKDCALLWRPHPMSNTVTKLHHPDQYPAWQKMLRRADAAENVLVDKEASCFAAFSVSRAMISDYSSMLPQYLLLDKPALWIRGGGFRFTGEEFIDSRWMEEAGCAEDVLAFFERLQKGGDPNAALRDAVRRRDLPLADGHCGERVCEAVVSAMLAEEFGK